MVGETIRREVEVLRKFVRDPSTGVFETIDEMIVVARRGIRSFISRVRGFRR